MSFVLYAAVVYFGVSLLLAIWLSSSLDESNKGKIEQVRRMPSPRREFAIAFTALVMVLTALVLVLYFFISTYFERRRQAAVLRKLKRTHRENVYEKIHYVNLPNEDCAVIGPVTGAIRRF